MRPRRTTNAASMRNRSTRFVQATLLSLRVQAYLLDVDGPARAGEKGTPCAPAGPDRFGGKSVAVPATVSGVPLARAPDGVRH